MPSQHPYYPPDASLPDYQPSSVSLPVLLALFGSTAAAVLLLAYAAAATQQPPLRALDRFAAAWFLLCAFLHLCFEGYFIYFQDRLVSQHTLFAMLWKEYALSDSRYLTGDVFTLCVEHVTVLLWGPLSLIATVAVVRRSPARHLLQAVLCTAHLYGVILYYATNWADYRLTGVSHSRPEFLYYWVYYVGFNAPWVVVPLALLYDSWSHISTAAAFYTAAQLAAKRQ